ncbi:MAG TPA: PaaX family transcriptional regulator C-terminal domain-containing protein [Beijerinckiaceae bacterium]|nr:PaaX family transcriptional regulator C-terminal domain-containing protein [Beijerinckiaceae bacterium]
MTVSMTEAMSQYSLLSRCLTSAPRGTLRIWSLAVSFLGDCIVPRGGLVGLSTISDVLGACGIDAGAVRTALSRLASDGWVARVRSGRNSYYTLTPTALAESQAASRRIYAADPPQAPCGWQVMITAGLPPDGHRRLRETLLRQGAGTLDTHSFILPDHHPLRSEPGALLLPVSRLADDQARLVVANAFDLAALARSYGNFLANHADLASHLAAGHTPADGLEAVALRVLMIHRFRRIVLRDPGLPACYLPADWPGFAARKLAHELRASLSPAAESWLDERLIEPVGGHSDMLQNLLASADN